MIINISSVSVSVRALVLLLSIFICSVTVTGFRLRCDSNSSDASGYRCDGAAHCSTFAILRTNPHYSSLSNLSLYLGITPSELAKANGLSPKTEAQALPPGLPLLIPIHCKCVKGFFGAELTVGGDIAESLEGLTSCRPIRDAADRVPLRCACSPTQLLLSYPIAQGDTLPALALRFHTTPQAILAANGNNRPQNDTLTPLTPLLIPAPKKKKKKKKVEMWRVGVYVGAAIAASIAVAGVMLAITVLKRNHYKEEKKKKKSSLDADVEMQQLSLSVRTTSDKKVSFEEDMAKTTPVETYTVEELERATDGFTCANHIDGSVFHGRISGKNLAIKRIHPQDTNTNMELLLAIHHHHHPNIMRLLGTCLGGSPSFLVMEYAKNGSLKDWIHGGLAIKNQFIASCYCFLTWGQRVKICLDVAMALHYLHTVMNPPFAHGNVTSRNIFLDEELRAKIGMPATSTARSTSFSNDIYDFGLVLLEALSGKTRNEEIETVMESGKMEKVREWMDSALGEEYSMEGAIAVANLGRACTEEDPLVRPNAGEVVEKLSRLVQELPQGDLTLSLPCESSTKPLVKAAANDSH